MLHSSTAKDFYTMPINVFLAVITLSGIIGLASIGQVILFPLINIDAL